MKTGIFQGRLSRSPNNQLQWFPADCWEDEFKKASDLGYDFIEMFIDEKFNSKNPIWSKDGIQRIKEVAVDSGLEIYSLSDNSIIGTNLNSNLERSISLIDAAHKLGAKIIVYPLFEESEITFQNRSDYRESILELASRCESLDIKMALETSLPGSELKVFIEELGSNYIGVVYDCGNCLAFNHDISSDIELLNKNIIHFHVKDRNNGNENVLLGTGRLEFDVVCSSLKTIEYTGAFTFETVRGNNPELTAGYNLSFLKFFLKNSNS